MFVICREAGKSLRKGEKIAWSALPSQLKSSADTIAVNAHKLKGKPVAGNPRLSQRCYAAW